MGEVVSRSRSVLGSPCLPKAWPDGPLCQSRGTSTQDSIRTSTLTNESSEGDGGGRDHPPRQSGRLCSVQEGPKGRSPSH